MVTQRRLAMETNIPAAPNTRSILIVEDEFLIAELIQTILEAEGFDVAGVAARAAPALEIADKMRPGLVLVDIRLAGGDDGVDLVRRMQANVGTPVIFLTGSGDPVTRARAEATSPKGFLRKPFRADQLIAVVRAALTTG
jgi:two-component system, response regulator PdtaR